MMFSVAMIERIGANNEGQENHQVFKRKVINDIYTKHRQAGKHQGQHGTVYSTSQRCCYA